MCHSAGLDFSGVPITFTFTVGSTTDSVEVVILDDNIVEQTEQIELILTTTNPDVIIEPLSTVVIDIIDIDGTKIKMQY